MLADRLRIVERWTDGPGMEGVEIVLVDVLKRVELVEGILRIVVSVAVVDVDGAGEVEGEGLVRLFEPVAEREVGAVDIKAGVHAVRRPDRAADGGIVLVDGTGGTGRIR